MEKEICKNCERLLKQNESLKKRMDELEARLKAYENAHTPSSFSRRRYPKPTPTGNPIGAPFSHPGKTRPQKKPGRIIDVLAKHCPDCESELSEPIEIQKKIIEDLPEPRQIVVTQFNQCVCRCLHCGKMVKATHPDLPEKGRLGPRLLTEISLLRYEDRLPFRKIAKQLQSQYGLTLTPASIHEAVQRTTAASEPAYDELNQEIQLSRGVNSDETSQNVQGERWWTWVFRTLTSVLFVNRTSRGQAPLQEVLGHDYQGIVTCDGWKPYSAVVKKIQRCWAHLLREAKWLGQEKKRQAKKMYRALCSLFADLKKQRELQLSFYKREQEKRRLEKEMDGIIQFGQRYERTKKFAQKIANGKDHWFTCVVHPEIEPTNNAAERALREVVIQRKIAGTLRNQKGTHAMEVLMSLIQTWKLRGQNPREMLLETIRGS